MLKTAKILTLILALAVPLVLIPSVCFAGPVNIASVQNFSGPVVVFWSDSNPATSDTYYVFISTNYNSLSGATVAAMMGDPIVALKTIPAVSALNPDDGSSSDFYYAFTEAITGQTYYMRVAYQQGAGAITADADVLGASSRDEEIHTQSIYSIVDSTTIFSYIVDYDSSTIYYYATFRGAYGSPFLGPAWMKVDIRTSLGNKTIFVDDRPEVYIDIYMSSSTFAAVADYSWSGYIYTDAGHKHNGGYIFEATPVDETDTEVRAGRMTYPTYVDVVHINAGDGLLYKKVGDEQVHYGPPFDFHYYLTKSCFFTMKIWDRNQTPDPGDDTLLKVVVSSVPRVCGDESADPADWDQMPEIETWDGRNEAGVILGKDVYRYTVEAIEFWGEGGSGYNAALTDRSSMGWGTIAFDCLRIMDVESVGITENNPLATIKYMMAGANSLYGGAQVKILICLPGTTFTKATVSGSMTYLNNSGTYDYTPGDPIPNSATNLIKTFSFARYAGAHEESWDGLNEAGAAVDNDNYVFVITAVDDSGNHAFNYAGDNNYIVGNLTVDRTASQQAINTTPPSIFTITCGSTLLNLSSTTLISQPFNTITFVLTPGGSAIDLVNTQISISGPGGAVAITRSNNGIDTITASFVTQSTNGNYVLSITPRDINNNTAPATNLTFILSASQTGAQAAFSDSVYAYPNPAKAQASITISYDVVSPTNVKFQVFTLLGEEVYSEEWYEPASGIATKVWVPNNNSKTKLATGVYFYRLTLKDVSNIKATKKVVLVQ